MFLLKSRLKVEYSFYGPTIEIMESMHGGFTEFNKAKRFAQLKSISYGLEP